MWVKNTCIQPFRILKKASERMMFYHPGFPPEHSQKHILAFWNLLCRLPYYPFHFDAPCSITRPSLPHTVTRIRTLSIPTGNRAYRRSTALDPSIHSLEPKPNKVKARKTERIIKCEKDLCVEGCEKNTFVIKVSLKSDREVQEDRI